MPFVKKEFTSSGSFVCPAGVTLVILVGYGGGGSGAGGRSGGSTGGGAAGGGGGGSISYTTYVTVVPNTTYTVTIGAGGTAPAAATNGNDGADTTFGSLATFKGAGKGYYSSDSKYSVGGLAVGGVSYGSAAYLNTTQPQTAPGPAIGSPGGGYTDSPVFTYGGANQMGYAGGAQASTVSSYVGGGGGGGGPGGVGAAGGNGNNAGTGVAGSSAAANTGAGGGGGGHGSTTGGAGGAGGSGKLIVMWAE